VWKVSISLKLYQNKLDKSKEKIVDYARNSLNRAHTKLSNKIPSWGNLLQAQISQQKHVKNRDHNYTQYLDENKENIYNLRSKIGKMLSGFSQISSKIDAEVNAQNTQDEDYDELKNFNSVGSSVSDKSVSEGYIQKNIPDSKIYPLKKFIENSKICVVGVNRLGKKSLKKIKQSSIRKWSKDSTQINFGTK